MTGFFMAWGMFLSIPCPMKKWDEKKYVQMLLFLPVIGAIIGGITYLFMNILLKTDYKVLSAAIMSALPAFLTGFIHIDGFMDCADAVLSRRSKEERIRILKDSHVGAFAVISIVLYFLILFSANYELINSLKQDLISCNYLLFLIFQPIVSRIVVVYSLFSCLPMKGSSYEKMFNQDLIKDKKTLIYVILTLTGLALIVVTYVIEMKMIPLFLLQAVITLIIINRLRSNLGGVSGDISGYAITISELVSLVLLVLWPK